MTTSRAIQLTQDSDRFTINNVRLGESYPEALYTAEKQFGVEARCDAKKTGSRNKMASLQRVCEFNEPQGTMLAEHKIQKASYLFIDNKLQQVDLEIETADDTTRDQLVSWISEALGLSVEHEGPVSSWIGVNDAALLVQQGNFQLRVVNRLMLPENPDYMKVTPRS